MGKHMLRPQLHNIMKILTKYPNRWLLAITFCLTALVSMAQERTVENRPYCDLRPFHFGVMVGTHLQDLELLNAGQVTFTDENGQEVTSNVTVDQDRWDPGFTVGVLGEFRLSTHFQFRIAPAMYFGTRHLTFHNLLQSNGSNASEGSGDRNASTNGNTNRYDVSQELKTAYISCAFDLIFAAPRFNNHRPYIMAGLNPMMNLSGNKDEYLRLKKTDLFVEVGVGCDFYLPFFKLRPELKFMYGLMNSYDKGYAGKVKDKSMLPYTLSAKEAHSKMIALTFYFE
jgi:hypothetical protein